MVRSISTLVSLGGNCIAIGLKKVRKELTMETEYKYKELLFIDLCSRLPYKPIVSIAKGTPNGVIWEDMPLSAHFLEFGADYGLEYIKPYLRKLSSMTEKEFVYFMDIRGMNLKSDEIQKMMSEYFNHPNSIAIVNRLSSYSNNIDWLNKNMFAYRTIGGKDMFELGLALEAPEGMYDLR
jgi:hypothetical protein